MTSCMRGRRALITPPATAFSSLAWRTIVSGRLYDACILQSATLGGLDAQFNLFVPANASETNKVPLLTYLSGLTCTEDNA